MDAPATAFDGSGDIRRAAAVLAGHVPAQFEPLARLAYNYWWSWTPGGRDLFASVDPHRWERCRENPVRLLQEVAPTQLQALASDTAILRQAEDLAARLAADLARPPAPGIDPQHPVAFICAEFGVDRSLPFYAGGLGVLAGDFLKEASDQALPVVAMGLFYWEGSFHQRLDSSGWQHEYWLDTDSDRLPAALVTDGRGRELTMTLPIGGRNVVAQIWRVDVGRVPLYLLDTNRPDNRPFDRWITARLYVGDREARLAQHVLLGIGGLRALAAMGIEPSLYHINEGHAALGVLELLRREMEGGATAEAARDRVRARTMFTTHTPVAAGNPTFSAHEMVSALGAFPVSAGLTWDELLALGRYRPEDRDEPFGLTPFALRTTGAANGVSRRHGEVSRGIWHALWPDRPVEDVPIGHITNGVHAPTWTGSPMADLLRRYLPGWPASAGDPRTWEQVDAIPDEEIWKVRCTLRAGLGAHVVDRSVIERLGRGEPAAYAESAATTWSDDALTVGFARRIATYKRLYLITENIERGLRIINGRFPIQVLIAGRAHPQDDDAKRTVQRIFALNDIPNLAGRVVFLEEHDLGVSARLVQGCDLWINLPRPPQEASGTSGMKSALNGGLQLSVLDGWWCEAWNGDNGWAIISDPSLPAPEQDARDASALFDLLEFEIIPLFYDRDDRGLPRGWIRRIRASLKTVGTRFTTTRMLGEYAERWRSAVAGLR